MNEEKKMKTLVFARRIVLVAVVVYIAAFFVWKFSSQRGRHKTLVL